MNVSEPGGAAMLMTHARPPETVVQLGLATLRSSSVTAPPFTAIVPESVDGETNAGRRAPADAAVALGIVKLKRAVPLAALRGRGGSRRSDGGGMCAGAAGEQGDRKGGGDPVGHLIHGARDPQWEWWLS